MPESESIQRQVEFLENRLEKRTNKFDRSTNYFKWWTYALKIGIFALSAIITVLAGWDWGEVKTEVLSRNLIVLFGAMSALTTSIAAFWNVERYWLENRVILERLKSLTDRVKYLKRREARLTQKELDNLWMEYQITLERREQFWSGALRRMGTPKPK